MGAGVATFNPSIAVDAAGDAIINFTASGQKMYPTDYFSVHLASDSTGSFGVPINYQSLLPGQTNGQTYQGALQSGVYRWGDYSAAVADPNDPGAFWISNEFTPDGHSWSSVTANIVAQTDVAQTLSGNSPLATPSHFVELLGTSPLNTDFFTGHS